LYYNNLADNVGSGMGEPSRFIKQIEYEYAKNNPKVELEYYQYKSPVIKDIEDAITIEKTDEALQKIQRLSPTSIGTYVRCPLQFYWKYIEQIKDETPEEEIQSNVVGSIIHDTLDNFYKLFGNDLISLALFDEMYKKHFQDCYQKALINNKFPNGLPDTGFNCLNKTAINNMLDNFIRYERKFLAEGNRLSIISTEIELTKNIDYQGYKIELYGKADRIDKVNDEIRVIDYKTGKVNPSDVRIGKNQILITDMAEKSIQLLIYKYLFLQGNPSINADNVNPGIIGFQKLSHGVYALEIDESHDLSKSFEENCTSYFNDFLSGLFNKNTPFAQTDELKNCSFCDFKNICKRG
jgi:ATP-dependent exoDNAse (exonuclease V) beta subunit